MTTAATGAPPASKRLIGLDLLRLLAVVLVLGRHMEPVPADWDSPLRPVFYAWSLGGGQGVDLFFVLSGFLVSGLLFAEYKRCGRLSVARFYVRRAWKIYPAFYALIAVTYLYQKYGIGHKMTGVEKISELFFLQSYVPGFWNHTWTLAVEEHFYLALPLVLLWAARGNAGQANPFTRIPWLVATSAVVILAVRIVNYALRQEYSHHTHAFPTHLRFDSLLFGVVIAYAYHFHADWFRRAFQPKRYAALLAGTFLFTCWMYVPYPGPWYGYTFGFTHMYLGAGAIVTGTLMCRIPENRLTRPLASLGAYSYSIYLWHMAFMRWVAPSLSNALSWQARTALYFVMAFVLGVIMAKIVEVPFLKIRDRLYPSRLAEGVMPTQGVMAKVAA